MILVHKPKVLNVFKLGLEAKSVFCEEKMSSVKQLSPMTGL